MADGDLCDHLDRYKALQDITSGTRLSETDKFLSSSALFLVLSQTLKRSHENIDIEIPERKFTFIDLGKISRMHASHFKC